MPPGGFADVPPRRTIDRALAMQRATQPPSPPVYVMCGGCGVSAEQPPHEVPRAEDGRAWVYDDGWWLCPPCWHVEPGSPCTMMAPG